ncbi:MAG: hypothetical protein ABI741_03865 [Ferruginibacter sp.]
MKQVLVCWFALVPIFSFSQINASELKSSAFVDLPLELDSTNLSDKISLSGFSMLDARDDSSDIGYFIKKTGITLNKRTLQRYRFDRGFVPSLTGWFTHYLHVDGQNRSGITLFANIKKLRYSEQIIPVTIGGRESQPNTGWWDEGVIIKIEYFLLKDSLFSPLYRYDSILAVPEVAGFSTGAFFKAALISSVKKIFTLNLDSAIAVGRKLHYSDILRINNQRYKFPVYEATVYNKGVYKTFEEFKMNVPFIKQYEFKSGKLGDILYVTENGKEFPVRDVWGYCDGKEFYINSGDKYSRLERTGNGFYFEGIKSLTRVQRTPVGQSYFDAKTTSGLKETKFKKYISVFQVDMETGEVY